MYQTHDAQHMIAICPSCHDQVHHGALEIDDEVLYSWIEIARKPSPDVAHLFVEPAPTLKLLLGTISLSPVNGAFAVFGLSNSNRLEIRVLDQDILQIRTHIQDLLGRVLLRVVDNHVRVESREDVRFESRSGRVRVSVRESVQLAPSWLRSKVDLGSEGLVVNGWVTVFDIEVVRPGALRVLGVWPDEKWTVVATRSELIFASPGIERAIRILGEGEATVVQFIGAIDAKLFDFQ